MTSKIPKEKFIAEVIRKIESEFAESIVIWTGAGCPDEDFDFVEVFEALWITDVDYWRFEDFVWDLEETFAEPNGYSIMVHSLSPEATRKFRWEEYQKERSLRVIRQFEFVLEDPNTNYQKAIQHSYEIVKKTLNEALFKYVEKAKTQFEEYPSYVISKRVSLPFIDFQELDVILDQSMIRQSVDLWKISDESPPVSFSKAA